MGGGITRFLSLAEKMSIFEDLRISVVEAGLVGILVLVTLVHGLPNLATSPPFSYDEGYNLQASSNLLRYGFYGTRDVDGDWVFDPNITTGPSVLLPVSLTFALFGEEGVAQARGVVLAYSALAVAAFYVLMRAQVGAPTSFLGAMLFSLSLYPYHRMVLGEAPGLFWLFLGAWLWIRTPSRPGWTPWHLAAGAAFGMAVLTKLTLGPIIVATLFLCWGLTRLSPSAKLKLSWTRIWAPLACASIPLIFWYGYQVSVVGLDGLVEQALVLFDYRYQMFDGSIDRVTGNLRRLRDFIPPGLALWAAPALFLAAIRLLKGAWQLPQHSFLTILTLVCAAYYLLSVGWARYSFWTTAVETSLVAMLAPVILRFWESKEGRNLYGRAGVNIAPLVWVALLAYPVLWTWHSTEPGQDEVSAVARFMGNYATFTESLGTTEWELDFLTGRVFRHPPTYVATVASDTVQSTFDWTWPGMDWVVIGPIGRSLGADKHLKSGGSFVERFSTQSYNVFQRFSGETPGWLWSVTGATRIPVPPQGPGRLGDPGVGQTFVATHNVLNEIRVMMAGEGNRDSATVRLSLYVLQEMGYPIVVAEVSGEEIVENRWYSFFLDSLEVTKGRAYYLELISLPELNKRSPYVWVNASADNYRHGEWHRGRTPQQGDMYFAVLGHNRPELVRTPQPSGQFLLSTPLNRSGVSGAVPRPHRCLTAPRSRTTWPHLVKCSSPTAQKKADSLPGPSQPRVSDIPDSVAPHVE